ncbi:MAG TPA: lactate racemase domain-containing protein [Gaiellaceae bacterium]|nr:lactate racemase domain-containing protein [Gaiellaceae bacterium]
MPRVPLLSGTNLVVADAEGAVVLRPPPPGRATDVEAATREALRFPLDGEPLEDLPRGAIRATIVVQPPALPIPSFPADPRQRALAAVVDALVGIGVPTNRQTLFVACGLMRRTGQRWLPHLVTPELARRFRGNVVVHDAEDPSLVLLHDGPPPLRVARELVETDLVIVVTSAESVLDGGPSALLAAAGAEAQRRALAHSLLETAGSGGWRLATRLESAIGERVPLLGASLVLNHPQLTGLLHGYPYEEAAADRIVRSPLRYAYSAVPAFVRRRILRSVSAERTAAAVLAGPPSIAHAEALLRMIELRGTALSEPLDALVIGTPGTTPFLPRESPNPLVAAHLGLAHALALWRDAFPVVDGGVAIIVSGFRRTFPRPTQQPYHVFFRAAPVARDPELLAAAEAAAKADARALEEYRAGSTVHPLLPFRDWDACLPALERLGSVYVAGARDATTVRQLGFVPIGGIGAAIQMARGEAGADARIGFLLSPPYFPLKVGG